MNAILSMSLALGRMIAHIQGKNLWQLLRDEMKIAVAKVIEANGGLETMEGIVSKETFDKVKFTPTGYWQLLAELPFVDLIKGLQNVERKLKKENKQLYRVLREQMLIYQG